MTVAFGSALADDCVFGLEAGRWNRAVIAACGLLCCEVAHRLKAPRPRIAASASMGVDEPDDLPDDLAERFVERLGERVVRFRAAIVCLLFESRWGDATNCSFAFGYRSIGRERLERRSGNKKRRFRGVSRWIGEDLLVPRRLVIARGLA